MKGENIEQVQDDPELLALMARDSNNAQSTYRPTNYWALYEKKFMPELQKLGLKDFRRRRGSVLSSFQATDLLPVPGQIDLRRNRILFNRITQRVPLWEKLLSVNNFILNKILPVAMPYRTEDIRALAYDFVRMYGEKTGAKSLDCFDSSLAGNPEDVINRNGKNYTMSILSYYLRYVYCQKYIDFKDIGVIAELGCGSGKQIEVIKKLYPDICFFVFDIPPQLYVCEQYLGSVFPKSIVSYRQTRNMNSFPSIEKGKIYILGNWKFSLLEKPKIDLFWNAASFQEMEPDVVANYLKYVNISAENVFLQERMDGKELARKKGAPGVLRQTKLEDYKLGLPAFSLLDISLSVEPVPRPLRGYYDSFWKKSAK